MRNIMQSTTRRSPLARIGGLVAAGAAAAGLFLATPAFAHGGHDILSLGDDDNLLQELIDLDADGIQDLRDEFADARADIKDAINDVEEAREEVKSAPGGAAIAKIAFKAAREATSTAVRKALAEANDRVDEAERQLKTADVSPEERVETQEAIDVLREGLASLEEPLDDLLAALDG